MRSVLRILLLFSILASDAIAQETANESSTETSTTGLQIARKTDEERVQFLLRVAAAYMKEKDYISAISAYERVLKLEPESREARHMVSYAYIRAKEYIKAERLLKALIAEYPNDFGHWNNLAWLYATAEDPAFRNGQKAVNCAQEAMVLAPKDHHVWSTLAEAHYVNGEYEKAYRAVKQMYSLATQKGSQLTREEVNDYNEQIRKCKRAMDLAQALDKEVEAENDEPVSDATPLPPSR